MTLYSLLRPLLFTLPPERAHRLAILALSFVRGSAGRASILRWRSRLPGSASLADRARRRLRQGWRRWPMPCSARASASSRLERSRPSRSAGNPRPRLFRLTEDRAVINRLGFNSRGQAGARERLGQRGDRPRHRRDQHRREQGVAEPHRRLCRRRAQHGEAGDLSDGEYLLAEHPRAARTAGRRRTRRAAGERAGGARQGSPADLPQGRARSRAGRDRRHRPHRDRPSGRRADYCQYDRQPAAADLAPCRRKRWAVRRRCATWHSKDCAISASRPAGYCR